MQYALTNFCQNNYVQKKNGNYDILCPLKTSVKEIIYVKNMTDKK